MTKETDYALRILRALADGKHLTAAELARNEQIPQPFAYKILKKLQKGGIIHILRGAGGGCVLTAQLKQVTLYRLMQIMGEDLSVSSCMKPGHQCEWRSARGNGLCHAHNHLASIQKKLNAELDSYHLQEILFGE